MIGEPSSHILVSKPQQEAPARHILAQLGLEAPTRLKITLPAPNCYAQICVDEPVIKPRNSPLVYVSTVLVKIMTHTTSKCVQTPHTQETASFVGLCSCGWECLSTNTVNTATEEDLMETKPPLFVVTPDPMMLSVY